MQFYLLMPGDSEEDAHNEANLLGEYTPINGVALGTFWAGSALNTLMIIVDKEPELLPLIKIRTDMSNKIFTLEEFLTTIQKLEIRTQR